jgi:rubrerythrin
MSETTSTVFSFNAERARPEKMVTLICGKCRMALYMSERKLLMPTWQCPSCGAITKTIDVT